MNSASPRIPSSRKDRSPCFELKGLKGSETIRSLKRLKIEGMRACPTHSLRLVFPLLSSETHLSLVVSMVAKFSDISIPKGYIDTILGSLP